VSFTDIVAAVRDAAFASLTRRRAPILVLVTLALVCGLAPSSSAQSITPPPASLPPTVGAEDGDRRGGYDAERTSARPDRRARPPMGVWRPLTGSRADDAAADLMTDGPRPYGSDGRMCWPHGDHVHCQ
jgi:hypothetical protein